MRAFVLNPFPKSQRAMGYADQSWSNRRSSPSVDLAPIRSRESARLSLAKHRLEAQ